MVTLLKKGLTRFGTLLAVTLVLSLPNLANAQDMDGDGVPDNVDQRPRVAGYHNAGDVTDRGTASWNEGSDSDGDGVGDTHDPSPWVASYYHSGGEMAAASMFMSLSPTTDSDRDGIPDAADQRPFTAGYYNGGDVTDRGEIEWMQGEDSDGDGVPDTEDQRKWVAGYYKPMTVDAPKPVDGDDDGDGVANSKDKCPGTPRGATVDKNGCPSDSDKDGVFDGIDKCPNTPAGTKVDASGCPMDSDGDGVADGIDKCPNTPRGAKVDANGCPTDEDGDGVFDGIDQCPGTPAGIPVDANGCPTIRKVGEKITLQINFATNSSNMDDASKNKLDGVAKTLGEFTDIKVAIGGFTDDRGSTAHNQGLSERRAKAVLDYLASKGVAKNRMTSKGWGEDPTKFVGDNATDEGRAKNRRVEIESVGN